MIVNRNLGTSTVPFKLRTKLSFLEVSKETQEWVLSENSTLQLKSGACCFNGKIKSKFFKEDTDTQRV